MAEHTSNENDAAPVGGGWPQPDPHGQAAMLLVESLIHGLVARSTITTAEAIEIVRVAAEVKEEVADEMGDSKTTLVRSLTLLDAIRGSLENDLIGP